VARIGKRACKDFCSLGTPPAATLIKPLTIGRRSVIVNRTNLRKLVDYLQLAARDSFCIKERASLSCNFTYMARSRYVWMNAGS
jgi:hypothetical protein